ncbi:MAG TPA: hypothetical protein DEO84_01375, partial [candidate division Zixibacteria bacterium]|nr:hypothetical protein [candidate division Zixibacteria bacterium]
MKFWIVVLVAVLLTANLAIGVSIAPEIIKQLKDSGQLQEIVLSDRAARARGVWQPNDMPYRFGATADVETLHCLIILVDFSDMTHESGFHSEPANFDTLLFSLGIRHPGSMADYYKETSYNQAYLTGQATPWLRMPHPYSYYVDGQRGFGNYPRNAQRLTEDAVLAADPFVNFDLYDNDGDGMVDALFVVHAGPGYEDTGNLNYIHSHAWSTTYTMNVDDVHVRGYSMEPEETGSGSMINIGVFCHEFGHVLGLPDLYDYDYDSEGVGYWSIMAGGSWGGGGAIPVHFDGWSKYHLGWAIPTVLTDNLVHEQIDAVEYNPDTYQLFPYGSGGPQYFLVENRRQRLFDVSIPGSGLLIYHIDENAPNNDNQTHYKVAVEQADGLFELEHNSGADASDPWPGATNHTCFDDFSLPNSHLYDGSQSEVAVANISDSDSIMYADLGIIYVDPLYELAYIFFNDSTGNSNGRPEPGETCQLIFSAQNIRAGVDDLVVTASCSDSQVLFSDSISNLGTMPLNVFFDNRSDLITFTIPMNFESEFANFTLTFTARDGLYHQQFVTPRMLGVPNLILVDDDAGLNLETYYEDALQNAGQSYEHWDISTQGSPAAALVNYDYAIWFTGDTRETPISEADVAGLIDYLNGGGRLLVTSQDFVQRLSERGEVNDTILLHQ